MACLRLVRAGESATSLGDMLTLTLSNLLSEVTNPENAKKSRLSRLP